MKIRELYSVHSSVGHYPAAIVGIECEIEDLGSSQPSHSFWNKTEDGSLRNNGLEFVSVPLTIADAKTQFRVLHNSLHYRSADVTSRFSERTSIHVHVNCLSLGEEQVRSIILWYALFEPLFFQMVAPARKNNIHCVSLNQTHLSRYYSKKLTSMRALWSKYTALNILPLGEYGTLEFRHMQGTDSQELFDMWLDTINNLWVYGQNNPVTKELIMSSEQIKTGFDYVFKDAPLILKQQEQLMSLMSDSLIDLKLSVITGKV